MYINIYIYIYKNVHTLCTFVLDVCHVFCYMCVTFCVHVGTLCIDGTFVVHFWGRPPRGLGGRLHPGGPDAVGPGGAGGGVDWGGDTHKH